MTLRLTPHRFKNLFIPHKSDLFIKCKNGLPLSQKFGRKKFASKPNSLRIFEERGLGGEGKSVTKPEAQRSYSTFK